MIKQYEIVSEFCAINLYNAYKRVWFACAILLSNNNVGNMPKKIAMLTKKSCKERLSKKNENV